MYRVFLSHSRRDNAAAQAVFRWLTEAEPSLKGETNVIGNAVWSDIFVSALKEANLAEPQYDNQHAETLPGNPPYPTPPYSSSRGPPAGHPASAHRGV